MSLVLIGYRLLSVLIQLSTETNCFKKMSETKCDSKIKIENSLDEEECVKELKSLIMGKFNIVLNSFNVL